LRVLAYLFFALLLVAVPAFFFSTAVGVVSGNLSIYMWGFNRHGVAADLGLTTQELRDATSDLLAYFRSPLEPVHVVVRGQEFFNERESEHLRDVKGLLVLDRRVQAASLAYIVAFIGGTWIWRRKTFWRTALRALLWGSGLTLFIILGLAVFALVGFDRLWVTFHLLSFSNTLWQLDPATDKLIVMMPEGFFSDLVLVTFGATAAMALVVGAGSFIALRARSRGKQKLSG
jgi:integral membrane protein (TIGR01906 family)